MSLVDYFSHFLLESGFFRFLGMMLVFPAGEGLIGVGTRLGLAIALAGLGSDDFQSEVVPTISVSLRCCYIISELLLGIVLGAPLLIIYHGLRLWADLFESLRGHQMGLIIDPLSGGDEQQLSILLSHAFLCIVLAQALFPLLLQIASLSLEKIAPGSISIVTLVTESQKLFTLLRVVLTFLFSSLLPFACLILMIEILMAVVSKLCSGWSLSQEGYLLRMLVLICMLYFKAPMLLSSCILLLGSAAPL